MTASGTIATKLLDWYANHARELPWRQMPGTARPKGAGWTYRVWLSEVMLQQTTVAAVIPYYRAFTARWPKVEALAAAPEEEVMAAWAGLGYYSRARNLVKCARAVAARGGFPETEAELRQLPGLGRYTAAAIAAIAFGRRAVVVDANVERVVARLFAIDEPLPAARKAIRRHTDTITPSERAGDFAQAMMDLGASLCTARDPKCGLCPLARDCGALAAGEAARFPLKAERKPKPRRLGTAYWIERDGHVWLIRRAAAGMLGAMRALPDDGWSVRSDGNAGLPAGCQWERAGIVRHAFTHYSLEMAVMRAKDAYAPPGTGEWWPVSRLDDAGLPTLFAKAARLVSAAR